MKIKVAQIGTSRFSHGNEIFNCLKKFPDVFEIAGYAMPENENEKFPDRVASFKEYKEMTVEEILNDISIKAVVIETEEIYLTKYALMAAKAGKHIHMEKPGGQSIEDFEQLMDIIKKNGTVFHTGYMYRYNPVIKDFIKRAKAGEIGDIVSVEAQMSCRHGEECVIWLSTFDGGVMFFLGCHLVDLVYQIQGMPQRIIPMNKSTKRFDGVTSKDNAFALLEYERGASFVKVNASETGGFERRNLVITGTKGRFMICPLERTISYPNQVTVYNEIVSEDWNASSEMKQTESFDRYSEMMLSFAAMVRGEKQNPFTCDYELELFKLVKKCCE